MFITALFTIAGTCKQSKCLSKDEWVKKDGVHTYSEILLNHRKEQTWVICSDVNGLRACHTEWNKSEREKQILTCVSKVQKWSRWAYLQHKNKDIDVENGHVDAEVEGEGEAIWKSRNDIYTLLGVCKIDG